MTPNKIGFKSATNSGLPTATIFKTHIRQREKYTEQS